MSNLSKYNIKIKALIQKIIPINLNFILNRFIIDNQTEMFIKHNKSIWKNEFKNHESEILVDFYPIPQTLIPYSYFLNVLANKHNACIKTFNNPHINSACSKTYQVLNVCCMTLSKNNLQSNPALYKVYQSFNTSGYITPILNKEQKIRTKKISQTIKQSIKTKQDVFNISIMGIWIGIDIYESYLRYYNKPTVDLDDPDLLDLIDRAIEIFIYWMDYTEKNKVASIVVSHDCYISFDILCKIGYHKKIPVYLPNLRGMFMSDKPHSVYSSRFTNYRKIFQKLPAEDQIKGIKLAKEQLQRRLGGEVGVDMPYSTKSAFKLTNNEIPILKKSDKTKVLICTHCFYDNPHAYGGMLFVDFYEWLCYLGNISEKTDYDWYIKMHPDPLPGTEEIIQEIIAEFPSITFIPPQTSHHQLANEGIDFALTVYGSVGHELPALGIQVINAGYNPHIAYDFNWHPKSIEEYEYYLLNIDKLHKEIDMEQLYEFYYMHYYYVFADNLFVESHKQFSKDLNLNQQIGSDAYKYFLNQFTETKHKEIIANINNFIESGAHNYFSRGPE